MLSLEFSCIREQSAIRERYEVMDVLALQQHWIKTFPSLGIEQFYPQMAACEIEEAASAHPDFFIFESLPGAGSALAPRLLASFGSQRDRYGSAEEVQRYSGIAPVMEKSGKKKWIHFRWACPKFLRQSFHEWAGHSISQSTWARAYYQQQRGRGKDHHAAVRALAFKMDSHPISMLARSSSL
jgi:transposase